MKRIFRVSLGLSIIAASLTFIAPPANAATTYSFTVAGASGRNGPTQSQVNTAYSGTSLSGTVTISTQGIQEWTVPASGRYSITVAGAGGGGNTAGKGAVISGEFTLTQGTLLKILVGQKGTASQNYSGGGGGGSFLWNSASTSEPIIAAGGGGGDGGGPTFAGVNASTTTSGTAGTLGIGGVSNTGPGAPGAGGTNGSAGTTYDASANSWDAAAGAGWKGNSTTATQFSGTANFALSPLNGGVGGASFSTNGNNEGGFGGGGGGGGDANSASSVGAGGGGYSGGGNGSNDSTSDRGAGGGGGSYNTGTNTSATIASTIAHGYITITSLGPSISSFLPRTQLTKLGTLTYDLIFSEAVTGLTSGDFTKSGSGSGTCSIGSPTGSGTTYAISLTSCSAGTVVLTLAANAVTNTDPQTAPSSNTDAPTVIIDQTAPTVSSVTAPVNSTYSNNQTPTFTMVFSESVTITGTPRLTLTVGASTKYANFLSLTDSKTATFRYTVTTDPIEFDTDGISVSTSIDLNGGAISDLATNAISNLTFTAPTLTSVFVAQLPVAPTIDSVVATSGTLTIYFTPGAARGSTTSGYQYTTDNNTFKNRETGTLASPLVITTVSTGATGLVNGTGYLIRIRAVTNAGNSSISNLVTETPTAISVSGDSTLTLTYGSSASTSAYSATGGTNTYTWSLGSSISGVTLSGTTVTAANTLAAGTYSQTIRATDGNSQVGTKSLTITVNKASTSISIALPNSATNAALGGAVTITATVPRAGSVNFRLDGSTISGCGSASAASTTATCTWTPGAMGSVSLTAIFTPTDSSNFESATSTSLSITVVTGESSVTLSLAGGTTTPPKGQAISIIATVDQAGRITFLIDGKRIPGCNNRAASVGNVTCSWKPAVQKTSTITARLVPTNNVYNPSTSSLRVQVSRRSGLR
jgi:hypothetical protein